MTTRRGFLGAILAAAVAPAIVRAGSLMPIKAPAVWVPPPLFTGEVSYVEAFRFIEQRELPRNQGDTIKFRRYAQAMPFVSAASLTAAWDRQAREEQARRDNPVFIVPPSFAEDLRAQGVPVAPPDWKPPRR